jgi:hypothetical protein
VSEKANRAFWIGLGLYWLVAVLCFGPATVQSERARAEYLAQCRADWAHDAQRQNWCQVGGPMMSDGAAKAIFWPLWLSYLAASR